MAKIRQEINIVCTPQTSDADSSAQIQIDTTAYSGSCLFYFEVVGKRASGTCTVTLHDASDNVMATCSITGTADALVRSSAFSPTAGAATYHVNIAGGSTTPIIKAARVVILQDSTPLTATETQIEIGSAFSTTSTSGAAPANPKYWKYTSANWDGTLAVYFEATLMASNTKTASSVTLQVADGSGDGFTGWAAVTNGVVSTTSTTAIRVRGTSPITLVAGRNYRIIATAPSTKSGVTVYNAKIVIVQVGQLDTATYYFDASQAGPTDTDEVWTNDPNAFDGSIVTAATKPSGSAGFLNGTGTTAPTSGGVIRSVTFRAYASSAGTTTWLRTYIYSGVAYLGEGDVTPGPGAAWGTSITLTVPVGGWDWSKVNALECRTATVGGADGIQSLYRMEVTVSYANPTVSITKLEPQYLLANTTLAAGTALQTFLTKWDSAEWAGVTNAYYHAVSASDNNTSVVVLNTAGGTLLTGSTITSPDNQGISGTMTMPADQNLDVKATTNSGNLFGSRILVACVVTGAAGPVNVKTWCDLAKASVKTVDQLAIASVKKINGLE